MSTFCGWIVILLAAVGVAGQGSGVQVQGRVQDENGVVVAGVQVYLQAPGGRTQLVISDAAGRFEITVSAPGVYHATLTKPGFFRLSAQPIELAAGENQVSIVLHHETEVHEEVEVRSSAHAIDPEEATHRDTLSAREVLNIPVPKTHDLKSSLSTMPGVLQDNSNALHIAGARSGETQYLLDGFEVGDPASYSLSARINVDSVRSVEVASARHGAQYPHAAAGVLSLDTTTGDDKWRFGITNFIPAVIFQQGLHLSTWYPRMTLSGPLIKARAWFSDSASLQRALSLVKELPRGQNIATQWFGDNLFRAQFNLTRHHILHGSFLYNQSSQLNQGLTLFTPLSTTVDLNGRRCFFSVKDQVYTAGALWEIGFAGDVGRGQQAPQGTSTYVVMPTGTSGNFFEEVDQRARRWQGIGSVLAPSHQWHGTHDLSAGFNVDEVSFNQNASRSAIDTLRQDGTLLQRTTFSGPAAFGLSQTQFGVFAQDAWRIVPQFRVQAGLRADWNRLFHSALVEPRLSGVFLPFADDRGKLSAGWGVYYRQPNLVLIGEGFDQQRVDIFFDSTGLTPVLGPAVTRFELPPAGLRHTRFEIASVGWQQQIRSHTLAGIEFINRRGRTGLAYENLFPGQPGTVFLLQNNRQDHYRSVEFSLRHSFGERVEIFGNYIRSVARSNKVLDPSLGSVLFTAQAPGPLSWDAPNRVLSWGWTPIPFWHLLLSYFFEYRTGFPFSVVDQQQQLVGTPNRLRFPDYISLNLGVEKRFRFHQHEWALRLAPINITGHSNPNAVVNNVDAPDFLRFARGQGRAFTARLRLVGKY